MSEYFNKRIKVKGIIILLEEMERLQKYIITYTKMLTFVWVGKKTNFC